MPPGKTMGGGFKFGVIEHTVRERAAKDEWERSLLERAELEVNTAARSYL